jgi:O-antigen ligase/polysaccharide polymerase Wzy-like membrane protein
VAFLEFDRVLLYVGVGALAVFTGRRLDTWSDGIALGTAAVAAVALASRFFPSLFPTHNLPQFLPGTAERLSYPVDYWNGLAVLLAIGTPLLLRAALAATRGLARALAAAALPGVAAAIYLTASRTGAATVLVAAALFVVLASDRWAALITTLLVSVGSAGAIVVLLDRPVLVNGPFDGATAATQGRIAAVLVLVVCVATGLLNHGLRIGLAHLPRPGRRAGLATASLALFLALVLVGVSHPRARLVAFARPPTSTALSQPDFVQTHLLNTEGSGRWQFWGAAIRQFESRPLVGHGAGSYESWWAEHGSLPVFVRYAHSLYLEVLGELGLFGLLLLLAALGSALVAGITAITRARGVERTTLGALFAAATAFLVALGVDWMWQLTVVSVVGVACLGLVMGCVRRPQREPTRPAHRGVVRAALVVTALLAIACEAMPLLTQIEVQASQAAARRGDVADARARALTAAHLEPWASSPYLQIALVDEQRQDLQSARRAIRVALNRDDRDWRLWLVSARIETKLGAIGAAKRSIARAIRLNPRSSIFNRHVRDLSAHR